MEIRIAAVTAREEHVAKMCEWLQPYWAEVGWDAASPWEAFRLALLSNHNEDLLFFHDDLVFDAGLVDRFLNKTPSRVHVVTLFSMRRPRSFELRRGYSLETRFPATCATYIPAHMRQWIAEFDYGDRFGISDDQRFHHWARETRQPIFTLYPSLVDHGSLVSTVDPEAPARATYSPSYDGKRTHLNFREV